MSKIIPFPVWRARRSGTPLASAFALAGPDFVAAPWPPRGGGLIPTPVGNWPGMSLGALYPIPGYPVLALPVHAAQHRVPPIAQMLQDRGFRDFLDEIAVRHALDQLAGRCGPKPVIH